MALRRKTTNQGGPSHSWRRLEGKGMQRILVLSGIFGVLTFGILFCKLWQLQVVQHEKLENKAITQQTREISSTANRGTIYDRNMKPLVNRQTSYRACVAGFPEAIAAVAPELDEEAMAELEERLRTNRPAVVSLEKPVTYTDGLALFQVPERYSGSLLAPHLLGYLDGDGLHGVTGIEQAFDEYLTEHSGKATVTYKVDAAGRPLQGEKWRSAARCRRPRRGWC